MKMLSLFSGIGGLDLAAEWAGIETVMFCERDEKCREILRLRWPNVPIVEDVKDVRGFPVDIICGGYPCQPFSLAGERKGESDERHLWPEMLRIVRDCRPAWVVCENVKGHVTLGLDTVLDDLEREGYAARPFVISAFAVGAKHARERLFVVSHDQSQRLNYGNDGADIRQADRNEHTPANHRRPVGGVEAGRWAAEPGVGRVVHGVSATVDRLRMLGNAVIPQQAYPIFNAIAKISNGERVL